MFGDVSSVVFRFVLHILLAIRSDHAHLAVVEVDLVVGIDQTHVVGVVGVDITDDQVEVLLVAQHDVVEGFQAELGKFNGPAPHLLDLNPLLLGNAFGQPPRNGCAGMDLAPADDLDHGMTVFAHLDDLAADLQANLVDDPQDIAFSNRGIRAHDEVRTSQGIKVGGVVGGIKCRVKQFAQFLAGGWHFDVIDGIHSLGSRHVVRLGADTANAVGQEGHFLHGATNAETFETAQFRDLEVSIGNIAFLVEKDLDLAMAFQPGDGINGNPLHIHHPFCADLLALSREPARLNR